MQPGQVFTPRGSDEPPVPNGAPNPDRGPTGPPEPTPPPVPPPELVAQPVAVQAPPQPAQPYVAPLSEPGGWQFHQESNATVSQLPIDEVITWTGSEFISNEKGAGWYAVLFGGSVVFAVLIYLLTKDKVSAATVVLASLVFASFAAHKPRTQQYGLSRQGVQIGMKTYGFQDFKTFSVVEEGAIASIVFMPLKRFMPPLTIYVAPEMEERVITYLSAFLPFEQRRADAIDSLLRRIRF